MATEVQLKDLLALLDDIASRALAEEWDNVGLMVGDPAAAVTGIMVALDPTAAVLAEASAAGCNTVITHHPLIFKPLKALRLDEPDIRALMQAVQSGLAVISCHTNLDKIGGGVSEMLASGLGLGSTRPLALELHGKESVSCGFGRVGDLPAPLAFAGFIGLVKKRLGVSALSVAGPAPEKIVTVAVCGGSGSELAPLAQQVGAQVYLSGEIKHSTARWAEQAGFCVIDAGHFATEQLMVSGLARILRQRLAEKGWPVEVLVTAKQESPFNLY